MFLSNPFPQRFTLPKPSIYYIFGEAQIILAQKLMKCCKAFKILHLQFDKDLLYGFRYYPKDYGIDLLSSVIKWSRYPYADAGPHNNILPSDASTLGFSIRTIKILNWLSMGPFDEKTLISLLPKLELTQIRKAYFHFKFEIKPELWEQIFQPLIELLVLEVRHREGISPVLIAFQKCPNLEIIDIENLESDTDMLSAEDFKQILRTKKELKMKEAYISSFSNLDSRDVVEFMDNFVAKNGDISFNFLNRNFENFEILQNAIAEVAKKRENKCENKSEINFFIDGTELQSTFYL